MEIKDLKPGMRIHIIEYGEVIDEATILRVQTHELAIQSLRLYPGETIEFAPVQNSQSYRMLFEDPAGGRCFSQRAPTYRLEPA